MVLNKITPRCTDFRLRQGELRAPAGFCFKRGLKIGFALGIKKGEEGVVKKKKKIVLNELKRKAVRKAETNRMMAEDVNVSKPSLKTLYKQYKARKADARERDFFMQLKFKNREYNRVSATERKAMGTEPLRQWAIRSGEYVK